MFRGCVISHGRWLMTAASSQKQLMNRTATLTTTTYRSQVTVPYNQLLGFRSLSTAPLLNPDWLQYIQCPKYIGTVVTLRFAFLCCKMLKKKYDYYKYVKTIETVDGRCLKYEITGFKGAKDWSVAAEIVNGRELVVSGYRKGGRGRIEPVDFITLPFNDYSKANMSATFYRDVGLLAVEISDFGQAQDIKIQVETKAGFS